MCGSIMVLLLSCPGCGEDFSNEASAYLTARSAFRALAGGEAAYRHSHGRYLAADWCPTSGPFRAAVEEPLIDPCYYRSSWAALHFQPWHTAICSFSVDVRSSRIGEELVFNAICLDQYAHPIGYTMSSRDNELRSVRVSTADRAAIAADRAARHREAPAP